MADERERLRFWRDAEQAAATPSNQASYDVASGVAHLQSLAPAAGPSDDDDPIFLLAAGWRSGSTLLQRCIMSDTRVLMWGEPYQESGLVQHLAESTRAFRAEWPKPKWFFRGTPPDVLATSWVANLFPPPDDLRLAHRALLDTLFAAPARRAGASRWGIKEVRWTSGHARYLRWLYPRCRLVFLYRDPFMAYRSYLKRGGGWYDTFPGRPVFTPTAFGRHWRTLTEGFVRDAAELDAVVLRFEDVVASREWIPALERHLDIRIDPATLDAKLDGAADGTADVTLGRIERWLLRRAVSPFAHSLGLRGGG